MSISTSFQVISIDQILNTLLKVEGVRITYLCSNFREGSNRVRLMFDMASNFHKVKRLSMRSDQWSLEFPNNSKFSLIPMNTLMCGERAHIVIVDKVTELELQTIVLPFIAATSSDSHLKPKGVYYITK